MTITITPTPHPVYHYKCVNCRKPFKRTERIVNEIHGWATCAWCEK